MKIIISSHFGLTIAFILLTIRQNYVDARTNLTNQPQGITLKRQIGPGSINVSWNLPNKTIGQIYKYKLQYYPVLDASPDNKTERDNIPGKAKFFIIRGINSSSSYAFKVKAFTNKGVLESQWNLPDIIPTPPRYLKVKENIDPLLVKLEWEHPLSPGRMIKNYFVKVKGSKAYNRSFSVRKELVTKKTFISIKTHGDTFYTVTVTASTNAGEGNGTTISFTTAAKGPPKPKVEIKSDKNGKHLILHPVYYLDGIASWYQIQVQSIGQSCSFRPSMLRLPGHEVASVYGMDDEKVADIKLGKTSISDLPLFLPLIGNFTICFRGIHDVNGVRRYGAPASKNLERRSLPPLLSVTTLEDGKESFAIAMAKLQNRKAMYHQVCVMEVRDNSSVAISPDVFPPSNLKPFYWATHTFGKPYITAEFSDEDFDSLQHFEVGDGKVYEQRQRDNKAYRRYLNAPLRQGGYYAVFHRAFESKDSYFTGPWGGPVRIKKSQNPRNVLSREDVLILGTILPLIAFGVVIGMTICIMFIKRRGGICFWQQPRDSQERASAITPADLVSLGPVHPLSVEAMEVEDAPIENIAFDHSKQRPLHSITESLETICDDGFHYLICTRITQDNYKHVKELIRNKDTNGIATYQRQYEAICQGKEKIGSDLENSNIDATSEVQAQLTVLQADEGDATSNKENVTYIEDVIATRPAIAVPHPSRETLRDIWDLIVCKNVGSIVVICEEQEGFPLLYPEVKESITFGSMEIETVEMVKYKLGTQATVLIKEPEAASDDLEILCEILHITSWPDHKVPVDTDFVVDSAIKVRSQIAASPGNSPILVICNDGLGRCGCFITIMMAIDRLAKENSCDIVEIVTKIRELKPEFIENEDQYLFCYDVVADYFKDVSKRYSLRDGTDE